MGNLFSEFEQRERDERLSGAVTSYGVGTRSYGKSGEAKESKRQMAETTERYKASNPAFESTPIPPMCTCPQRAHPHELSVHATLASDWAAWSNGRPKNSWPWSLRNLADSDGPR